MNIPITSLMERNLFDVFGQRDALQRKAVMAEIFAEDCAFFEGETVLKGREAIASHAQTILDGAPGFVFRATLEAQISGDLARINWSFGPADGPPVVTGLDAAFIKDGCIQTLYTFLDRPIDN